MASSRLQSVDSLRGIAALAVVVDHAVLHAHLTTAASGTVLWIQTVLRRGDLGVSLFFVISGFCIHLTAASGRQFTALQFWKRRLRRLYPPYFVALVCCMAIVTLGVRAHLHAAILDYPEPRLGYVGLDFLAHATMLHGLVPLFDRMGGDPPFWSLAREEYYYALYLPLLLLCRRRGFSFVGGAITLSVLASWILYSTGQTVLKSALFSIAMWSQWLLGMIAVEAYCGRIRLPRLLTQKTLVPVWGVLGLLAERFAPPLAVLLFGLCFFQMLNWAVTLEKSGRWPQNRLLVWLSGVGVFSYSLYLVHNPLVGLISRGLGSFGASDRTFEFTVTCLIIFVSAVYAGRFFFWAVERHFLNPGALMERGRASGPAPTAGLSET